MIWLFKLWKQIFQRKTNYEEYPPDNRAQAAYVIKENLEKLGWKRGI